MDFRLLGPLEVRTPAGPLPLGGIKQRGLLALLLLHRNEAVASDRLIEELWGPRPPRTAAKALQVQISSLRKLLEPDRAAGDPGRLLLTRAPGYVLEVDPDDVDLARFERLRAEGGAALAAGDAAGARDRLAEALALWRGQALADLAYEPFAQPEAARLEELRLAALEERIEADLRLGRHADVVSELEAVVAAHPLREGLWARLMLALYRSGRQAEALAAYTQARAALIEELGLEPGRELRELQAAILRQDAALDPAPAHEPARPVFVGRERELGQLTAALEDALAGRGRLALVAGEPGIGKSRLIDELAARAAARGARVLVGRCWEAGGAPAYWPWVQALRAHLADTPPDALPAQLGAGAPDLAQLLPEVRELLPGLPDVVAPDAEGARFRLFEAVAAFLRRAAQAAPLVVVLDDLHAADEPSLLLLRFVARELPAGRVLLVCAYRDVDPTPRDPLTAALAQLAREPHTAHVALASLTAGDVGEYIERATGTAPPPGLVGELHRQTEGNPLFVVELVDLLAAEGRIAEADGHLGIPPGVRAVIGQRVARLAQPCRELLVDAAVIGREFGLELLARLAGLPEADVLDVLDDAMAERIVGGVPGSAGRLRFGHALIRDTLYDELTPGRRLRLHLRAGEALEALCGSEPEPHLAELARHFLAAAPAGGAGRAIDYATRAGDRAASLLAYEEAARLYATALDLVTDRDARCELLLRVGDARAKAGDTPAARDAFHDAAELAAGPGQLTRAALGYSGRMIWEVSRGDERHVPLLERALAAAGPDDGRLRVLLLARLAGGPLRDNRFDPERKRRLGREALEVARRLDDPGSLVYALHGFINAHRSPATTPQMLELGTELTEVAAGAGDTERVLDGREERFAALLELSDVAAARAELDAMAALAAELRQPAQDWLVAVYRALMAQLEGRLDDAERLVAEALRLGGRTQSWNADVTYRLQLAVLRWEQGRLAEVEDLLRRSVDEHPTYPVLRCALAHTLAATGSIGGAGDAFDELTRDDCAALPFDEEWLVSLVWLAEVAHTLGDDERAAALYRLLEPYAGRLAISVPEISLGPVARSLGVLAATAGEWRDAARHFEAATAECERIGARSWLARTQADYAAMRARASGS